MESRVNYAFVGIFVISLITALILIGTWLSTQWKGKIYTTYAAYMSESVSGLALNSPVKYSGVKVGYVSSMTLDPQNPQHVRLLMKIETTAPITEATTATLVEQGLTGVGFIELHAGTNHAPPLLAKPGELYPVIKTAPSLFTRLDRAVSEFLIRLNKGMDVIDRTFDPRTQESFRRSIKNIDNITTSLANNVENFNNSIKSFDESMLHLKTFIKKGEVATDQLNVGLKAFSGQTLPQVNQLLGNLTITSTQLNEVGDQLVQNPGVLTKGRTEPAKGPGE